MGPKLCTFQGSINVVTAVNLLSLLFTNRSTLYQSQKILKFTLKLILKLLLHVSVYDHH